jgi:predicted phosphoadenosine phosphosulfate sulfurtransferase
MSRIASLVSESKEILGRALALGERPLIAYSGGKDAIVMSHIAYSMGCKDAVSEVSFYFAKQNADTQGIGAQIGLHCDYRYSLNIDWLRRHRDIIFSNDSKVKAWSYAVRQQATVKGYAKRHGYGLMVYGRRTQENCVPKDIYKNEAGWQCHPLRAWKTDDIWEYLQGLGIRPWIYDTPWGKAVQGNGPFYSISKKHYGDSIDECWKMCEGMDPMINPSMLD